MDINLLNLKGGKIFPDEKINFGVINFSGGNSVFFLHILAVEKFFSFKFLGLIIFVAFRVRFAIIFKFFVQI